MFTLCFAMISIFYFRLVPRTFRTITRLSFLSRMSYRRAARGTVFRSSLTHSTSSRSFLMFETEFIQSIAAAIDYVAGRTAFGAFTSLSIPLVPDRRLTSKSSFGHSGTTRYFMAHRIRSNQPLQPTAGRSDSPLQIMKTHPAQTTLAPASGA